MIRRLLISGLVLVSTVMAGNNGRSAHFKSADSSLAPVYKPFQIVHAKVLPESVIVRRPASYLNRLRRTGILKPRNGFLATALAANWASFYLKGRADDAYSRYQRSANSKNLARYYNQARQLDNMATISLLVSGVALATYMYLVLKN